MRYIVTTLLILLSTIVYGQSTVPFGATRIQDTSYTKGSLRSDGDLRFIKYATNDSTKVLGIDANGKVVLRTTVPGIDTSKYATRFFVTSSIINAGAAYVKYADTATLIPTKSYVNNAIVSAAASYVKYPDTISLIPTKNFVTFNYLKYADTPLLIPTKPFVANTYTPQSRTVTINGTSQDLSANRTYNVGTVTSVAATATNGLSVTGSPITSTGSLAFTIDTSTASVGLANKSYVDNLITSLGGVYVPLARTITINGVSQSLAANRTYTVGTATTSGYGITLTSSGTTINYDTTKDLITPSAGALRFGLFSRLTSSSDGFVSATNFAGTSGAMFRASGIQDFTNVNNGRMTINTGQLFFNTDVSAAVTTYVFNKQQGTGSVAEFRYGSVTRFGINTNGGAWVGVSAGITSSAGYNSSDSKLEIGNSSAVSTDAGFGTLGLSNNQTGTANAIGSVMFINSSLGVAEKRVAQVFVSTDGATNSGQMGITTWNAGSAVTAAVIKANGEWIIGGSTAAGGPIKMNVIGDIKATATAYSSGGIAMLGRNATSGNWQSITNSTPSFYQTATVTGNTTFVLPANTIIEYITITPVGNETIRVGTTSGGTQISADVAYTAGTINTLTVGKKYSKVSTQTIFIQGAAGSVAYEYYYK